MSDEENIENNEEYNMLPTIIGGLSIKITDDGNYEVDIDWLPGLDDGQYRNVGTTLFHLNEGNFRKIIANVILEKANSEVAKTDSGKKIMDSWESEFLKQNSTPVIKPSDVFK